MDNNQYILISLNYYEMLLTALVLLYAFLFSEKKYFTNMFVSVINRLLLFFRGIFKNKKHSQSENLDNMEEK